uniref:Putative early nodulin-like protein 1 n=1 Tax=Davidia involucrata TaxID=16924 RepID=A0A5B7BMB8_DAVIN
MANTILSSNHHHKAFHVLGLLSLLLLMIQKGGAYEFRVGGSNWTVPTDANAFSYNQWAETHRFQTGDTLLFVYPADGDSVLHVKKEAYTNCNTATCMEKFSDGHTVFKLDKSGPYYFISGVKDHCLKNEKLVVVVLADRSNQSSNTNQTSAASPSPSPSPSGSTEVAVPSPSPAASEKSPSPAPGSAKIIPSPSPYSSEESSPPTPSGPSPAPGSVIPSPSPSPSSEETPPPPSGASSTYTLSSMISSIGAFVGLSLLLVF